MLQATSSGWSNYKHLQTVWRLRFEKYDIILFNAFKAMAELRAKWLQMFASVMPCTSCEMSFIGSKYITKYICNHASIPQNC